MFCTNCGNKLEEGVSFCSRCGSPVEKQPVEKQPELLQAEKNRGMDDRWIDWGLYELCSLAAFMGMMKWIKISVPLVDEISGSWHLHKLVSFLKEFGAWADEEELIRLSKLVSLPLLLWGAGIFFGIAGAVISEKLKNKKAGRICLGGANAMLAASGGLYLMMVYGLKNEINHQVSRYIGIELGGGVIQVPMWPKLMVIFGVAGLLASAYSCYLLFQTEKAAEGGGFVPADRELDANMSAAKPIVPLCSLSHVSSLNVPGTGGLLVLQEANNPEQVYGCDLETPCVAGRDASICNMVITSDKSISRQHCIFYLNGKSCWVEDLKSFNHTYLNGRMIAGSAVIKRGDRLVLGNLHLIVLQCDID